MSQAERDRAGLEHRVKVIRLPMVPMRHLHLETMLTLPADSVLRRRAQWPALATGIGPVGGAAAAWRATDGNAHFVASDTRDLTDVREIGTELRVDFVQPLPQGRVLVASAHSRDRAPNAEVWSAAGELLARACIGYPVSQVLATAGGSIWVGYSDEALSSPGPEYGFARFTQELAPAWLYGRGPSVPDIVDGKALNVVGETAYVCAYRSFHLVSVTGAQMTDHGRAPTTSPHALLIQDNRAVFLGGLGQPTDYDMLTSTRIGPTGIDMDGPPRRLVRPDGIEIWRSGKTCRGATMYLAVDGMWFTTTLDEVHSAPTAQPPASKVPPSSVTRSVMPTRL